ncbi:DMT family transporter [Ramlibacter tataouinensis]|uniref:Candidate transporter n=1 Tax=Ramlibacter tataouinensis (strain ATCC BAA-407 / DSM 14655 / LMG 21543 / TTB310) TaxID=365046 RepID=F5Y3U3_RAMTT|nr:DMT family transporter [Ramlibacter tataouinensis]AEG93750.1 Candidate transporter [Ramlibacter tataouinensis TTB310]
MVVGARAAVGLLLCSLAMVTVGSTVVASKLMTAGLPPFTATALRFALALPVFCVLMAATGTRWPRPGRHDAAILAAQAGAGSVGYTVLMLLGTRLASGADAGVVAGTLPAVAAGFALLVLRERLGPRLLASLGLALAGVLVVTLPAGEARAVPGAWLGNLLVLGAVGCEAVFILLNKRLRQPLPALALSSSMAALGLLLSLLPALLERPWRLQVPASAWAATAYYAWVPTVLGFWLWYAGAARLSGGLAALTTAWLPVSALALSALVLGEVLGAGQLAGCALVLGGVLLGASAPGRRPGAGRL